MQFTKYRFKSLSRASSAILLLMKSEFSLAPVFVKPAKSIIEDFLKPLRKNISVFIEAPYVDKVYRDSYYHYYSTKYRIYERDCIRVSFFRSLVKENHFFSPGNEEKLNENFLGYCIIRPTFPFVIGRNLLSKDAFENNDFVICQHEENVLINGNRLKIAGFPHSSQDRETITCAETTLWAIMEYFGHKYAEYKPVLPSTIRRNLEDLSEKRMLPSNGLYDEQISFALKNFGFGTMIYSRDNNDNFFSDLSVFVESGIPVVAVLQNKDSDANHAILMIGREKVTPSDKLRAFDFDINRRFIPFDSLIEKYVVQDDNVTPYTLVPLQRPGSYEEDGVEYVYEITTFIAPLYKKMYLDIKQARKFFEVIASDNVFGIKTRKNCVFRMYMASGRSFKEHIAKQGDLDPSLRNVLLSVSFPKFIWCGEFINKVDAYSKSVTALIVLDASEGDENWRNSFIFAARKQSSIFYVAMDNTYEIVSIKLPFIGFKMYDHNLN